MALLLAMLFSAAVDIGKLNKSQISNIWWCVVCFVIECDGTSEHIFRKKKTACFYNCMGYIVCSTFL
jgi:hypothetical protein